MRAGSSMDGLAAVGVATGGSCACFAAQLTMQLFTLLQSLQSSYPPLQVECNGSDAYDRGGTEQACQASG